MSDFIQYTQWKQREEVLPRELERRRAIGERLAADQVARRGARHSVSVARAIAGAFHTMSRAAKRRQEPEGVRGTMGE